MLAGWLAYWMAGWLKAKIYWPLRFGEKRNWICLFSGLCFDKTNEWHRHEGVLSAAVRGGDRIFLISRSPAPVPQGQLPFESPFYLITRPQLRHSIENHSELNSFQRFRFHFQFQLKFNCNDNHNNRKKGHATQLRAYSCENIHTYVCLWIVRPISLLYMISISGRIWMWNTSKWPSLDTKCIQNGSEICFRFWRHEISFGSTSLCYLYVFMVICLGNRSL